MMGDRVELRITLSDSEALELYMLLGVKLEDSGPHTDEDFISMAERIKAQLQRKLGLGKGKKT